VISQYRNIQNDVSAMSGIYGRGLNLPDILKEAHNKYLQDWEIGSIDGESEPERLQ
jgi:hypothetical protein